MIGVLCVCVAGTVGTSSPEAGAAAPRHRDEELPGVPALRSYH